MSQVSPLYMYITSVQFYEWRITKIGNWLYRWNCQIYRRRV